MWPEYLTKERYFQHIVTLNNLLHRNLPEDEYKCPICLATGGELTQEHVPQHALGGKKLLMTCRQCNSSAGHNIDNILIDGLYRIIEQKENACLRERRVKIEINGQQVNAIMKPGDNTNEPELTIDKKRNRDDVFDKAIASIAVNDDYGATGISRRVDDFSFSAGMIKNAYLALFAQFGYTFLLDWHYDIIRNHIIDPESHRLPRLYTVQQLDIPDGVYKVEENIGRKPLRFFLIIMPINIKCDNRLYKAFVALPTPKTDIYVLSRYLETIRAGDKLHLIRTSEDDLVIPNRISENLKWAFNRK